MHTPDDQELHAEGYISDFEEAMELVAMLWGKVHPACKFVEAEGTDTDGTKLELPQITFQMKWRKHAEGMSDGKKPRVMKVYPDPDQPGHNISETTEWFECLTEFHVFGSNKLETREWKNKLELFMLTYVGSFKKSGIQEVLFLEETKPEVSTVYRQDLPHRLLRYMVRIQRTQLVRNIRVSEIEVGVSTQTRPGITERFPTTPASMFETMLKQT